MKLYYLAVFFLLLSCNQKENNKTKEKIIVVNDNENVNDLNSQIAKLNQAILADPSNAKLYNNRGAYLISISEFRKAEKDLLKSLDLNSNDSYTWDNYGTLKAREKDFKGAIAAYKKAVELSPENSQFVNNLGWALLNDDLFLESIKYFDKAINLDSNSNQTYANKGLALIGLKQNEKGCMFLQKALSKGFPEAKKYIIEYCK